MAKSWIEGAVWCLALTADVAVLVTAPGGAAFLATMVLAGVWCRKMDREARCVQLIEAGPPVLNL